ncbi:glycosyltransferase [Mycobacterium sp. 1274756.6]|uniref:glycosyltransferase family 2 protein n=1 Tax=Mycobacterium sp. 1274756.6 TaxID=1834076 RepID=UPI0008013BFC|nr:glycosyltransferase [Mycobacterium sp. 1274756.6]OBJ72428.1 glycosyl transferase [Mycobacterium sp. 1274756.6]
MSSAPTGTVGVVMITHNRCPETLATLEHMSRLPDAGPLVVVDNASTDGTADAVAARFPQVRLIRSAKNLGAAGRNLGVPLAGTDYVAFCDDDTRWQPGTLARAAELLDAHPRLGAVVGQYLVEPDLREDPLTPELRDSPLPRPDWLPGPALLGGMAGTMTVRATAFREVGGFSPQLLVGGEEELFAIDLATAGWWMCFAEDVLIHHAPSPARDPRRRRQVGIRNTLWTVWLRRPIRSALRRTRVVLGSAPRDLATVGACVETLRGLPWVLRSRQVVPADVEAGLRLLEEPQRHSRARRYVG